MINDNTPVNPPPDWWDDVREALALISQRDFYRLSRNRLIHLACVSKRMGPEQSTYELARELGRVIFGLIEETKPEGDQDLTRVDWQIYNLLKLFFLT